MFEIQTYMCIMGAINMKIQQIKETITIVKDYPIKGIVFKDITTLLENPTAFKATVDLMIEKIAHLEFDKVVGVESRGFFWCAPIAYGLSKSFVLARKPGKLPREAAEKHFTLEYGTNSVHIHKDAISAGDKILVVDDLIATGGTATATADLCRELGATDIHTLCLIDLPHLGGSKKLAEKYGEVITLIDY
ncbi:adenine phosphoribosyltransferase [Candidatus Marinimicrobia bacterium]|nr:adenine phosphoribosyltransferase [Candidatus Neomarinimicrobiota bacterium]